MENIIDIIKYRKIKSKETLSESCNVVVESISLLKEMSPLSICGNKSNPHANQINEALLAFFSIKSKIQAKINIPEGKD